MAGTSDRVLYIGTMDGLYRAEATGGEYQAQPLGLQGRGGIRYPIVIDRDDARRLYAGTARGGMFRSEDGGGTWREINEGIVYKEIWSTTQHPQTGELLAGTGPASLFKSSDGGDTWTECEGLKQLPSTKEWTFPNPPHVAHVKGLAVHADDPALIYGSVEEGWIVRSRDGGKTWDQLRDGMEFDAHYVYVMPDDPSVVVATSGQGFYRSEDGGDSWTQYQEGLTCRYFAQVAMHPSRPSVFLSAAAAVPPPGWRRPEGAEAGFFRSENRGTSWEKLSGGLPDRFQPAPRAVVGAPDDPDTFFVGMTDGSIWMTENSGESFEQILTGLGHVGSIRVTHR